MTYVPINILHTCYVMLFNPLNSMRQVLLPTRPQSCRRRLRLRGMTLLPAGDDLASCGCTGCTRRSHSVTQVWLTPASAPTFCCHSWCYSHSERVNTTQNLRLHKQVTRERGWEHKCGGRAWKKGRHLDLPSSASRLGSALLCEPQFPSLYNQWIGLDHTVL